MTKPDDDDTATGAPEVAGMPSMNPPEGGPNADPDAPDPGDLVPPRLGAPDAENPS